MNLRVFLAASAALLGVVAAEAAEGDPADYVRVCDAYGTGFFTIPGTETCLQLSGYVWFQVGATNDDGLRTPNYMGFVSDEFNLNVEGRLNIDARSETEMGTLRSYLRLQGDWPPPKGTADGPVVMEQAWLSLGGFRAGYTESAFVDTLNGGNSSWGSHSWGSLNYAWQKRALVQYAFSGGNGLYGTLSAEFDDTANYVPDVAAIIGVGQDWGDVWLKAAWDETVDPGNNPLATSASAWAASAGAHVNIPGMDGSSLRVIGYYASDDSDYDVGGEWSLLASYLQQFNDRVGASVGVQYVGNTDFAVPGAPSLLLAELSVVYTPVTNFEIRAEGVYSKASGLESSLEGFVRFTRYF